MNQNALSSPPRPSWLRRWKAAVIFTRSPESAAHEMKRTKNRALPRGYKFKSGHLSTTEPRQLDNAWFVLTASDGTPVLSSTPGNDVMTTIRCLYDDAGAVRGTIEGSFEGYCEREVPEDAKKWIILDVRLKPWFRGPADESGTTQESDAVYGGIVKATNAAWLHYYLHVNRWHRWVTPYPALWAAVVALGIATVPPAWAKLGPVIEKLMGE